MASIFAEGNGGIDRSCAASGKEACQERHRRQNEHTKTGKKRVGSGDSEEQARYIRAEADTDGAANSRDPEHFAQNDGENLPCLRAQCEPNSELGSALRDVERCQSIY